MRLVSLRQWRERRMGVIWQGLGDAVRYDRGLHVNGNRFANRPMKSRYRRNIAAAQTISLFLWSAFSYGNIGTELFLATQGHRYILRCACVAGKMRFGVCTARYPLSYPSFRNADCLSIRLSNTLKPTTHDWFFVPV